MWSSTVRAFQMRITVTTSIITNLYVFHVKISFWYAFSQPFIKKVQSIANGSYFCQVLESEMKTGNLYIKGTGATSNEEACNYVVNNLEHCGGTFEWFNLDVPNTYCTYMTCLICSSPCKHNESDYSIYSIYSSAQRYTVRSSHVMLMSSFISQFYLF